MKKTCFLAAATVLVTLLLSGCQTGGSNTTGATTQAPTLPTTTEPTQTSATQPQSSGSLTVLETVWDHFSEEERFSTYGGTVEHAVSDAPGALDIKNTQELTAAYLFPQAHLNHVQEGASLVHMMNNNIFTSAVFRLAEGTDLEAVSKAWEQTIQQNRWICGQPERLLLVCVEDSHLLMAFGAEDLMQLFHGKVSAAYADARVLFDGTVVV